MSKPIAIYNNYTGDLAYVLEGYTHRFPLRFIHEQTTKKIEKINSVGLTGIYSVERNGFEHIIHTGPYSVIYEVQE